MRTARIACAFLFLTAVARGVGAEPEKLPAAPSGPLPAPLVGPSTTVPCCESPCDCCCEECCCQCGPPGRLWLSVEYIGWVGTGDRLPPLVSQSPPGTPLALAGIVGPATILFGDQRVNEDLQSGLQLNGGFWLDDCHHIGIEGSVFFPFHRGGDGILAGGTGGAGSLIVGRPLVDAVTGLPAAELVSFPGVLAGSVRVATSNNVWGGNVDGRYNLCCGCNYRLDALGGYRHLSLADRVQINEDLVVTAPASVLPQGTRLQVQDRFRTNNNFDGVEVGLEGEVRYRKLYLDLRGAVTLGNVSQTIDINGATVVTEPGAAPVARGLGILALGTNIGRRTRNDFAAAPTFGLRLGYQLTEHVRTFVGYDLLYLSTVTRPGDVIDTTINRSQVPPGVLVGPARPAVLGNQSDYFLQAITGGVEFRY